MRILKKFIPLLYLCSISQLWADEHSLDNIFDLSLTELMNIEVVSKKSENYKVAPGIVSVITAADIKRYGARNLRDVLDRSVNMQVIGSNLYPHNRVSLRGVTQTHTDNKILLLLNGRPVRDANQGGLNSDIYNFFPIHTIKKIEIIRGPGSVIYGTNAFSGVINITTKKEKNDTASLHLNSGSYSTASATGVLTKNYEDGQLMMAVSSLTTQGDSFNNVTDEFGNTGTYLTGKKGNQLLLNGNWKQFSFNFLGSDTKQDNVKSLFVFPASTLDIERTHIDLGYESELTKDWKLKFNVTRNNHEVAFDLSNTRATRTDSADTIWEATLSGKTDSWDWLMGTSYEQLEGTIGNNTASPTPFKTDRFGAYLQGDLKISDSRHLVLGGQWHKPKESSGNFSPRIAFVDQISNFWSYKLLYGEAFRSPFGTDLFLDSPFLKGNINLKPELIKTIDVQFIRETSSSNIALTLYHSRHEDLHTRELVGGVQTFVNRGEVKYTGIELEGRKIISDKWSLLGNASYQQNIDSNGMSGTTYNPEFMFKVGSSSKISEDMTVSIFDNYFGKPTSNQELGKSPTYTNEEAKAYHWLTLNFEADLTKKLNLQKISEISVNFYIDNLLDETIYFPSINRTNVTTLPHHSGRGYYLGLNIIF